MKYSKFKKNLLPALEKIGSIRKYDPSQMIYFQNEDQNRLFFVKKGRVRAFFTSDSGQEMTLEVIGEGRIFGENTLLSKNGRLNSVEAITPTELISCSIEQLLPLLQKYPDLLSSVFELMAATIANLSRQVLRLSFMSAPARVADFLLQVSEDPDPSLEIKNGVLPYTHLDVACSVNLNRTTVSRILKDFERKKLIAAGYKTIQILDSKGLALEAEAEE
ncbi:Crp/Fnr family transcriptional regulator [Ileibacterium valens]|uniref:Crp/Fnr family transcriptional regulator n=1 Tax=Ileibacterium valens TaxID=1862668 RepID=UPI0024B8CAE4|nr:Crp/Fnr family transcriptional regulator [Ileibacterium valens]